MSCRRAGRAWRRFCASTCRLSIAMTPAPDAPPPPCSTRSGAARPEPGTRTPTVRGSILGEIAGRLTPAGSAVRVREGARAVHDGCRDPAAVPRTVRPAFRRRGPRAGARERPRAPCLRHGASMSTRPSTPRPPRHRGGRFAAGATAGGMRRLARRTAHGTGRCRRVRRPGRSPGRWSAGAGPGQRVLVGTIRSLSPLATRTGWPMVARSTGRSSPQVWIADSWAK